MNELTIPYTIFKSLVYITDIVYKRKDPRYYLQRVVLTKQGHLVATDGHLLMVYRTDTKPDKQIEWFREELQVIVKLGKAKQQVIIDLDTQQATLTNTATPITLRTAGEDDGKYPDIYRVVGDWCIPKEGEDVKRRSVVSIGQDILDQINTIFKTVTTGFKKKGSMACLTAGANSNQMNFTFDVYDDRLWLVVMPFRVEEHEVRARLNDVLNGDDA